MAIRLGSLFFRRAGKRRGAKASGGRPLNLIFVNGHFPQASQTFVLSQIDHALESGDHVEVYCRLLEPRVSHPLIRKWGLYRRFLYAKPVDKAVLRRVAVNALRYPLRYLKALRLRQTKAITWNEFLFAMQLTRKPDLFIANFGPNGIVAARLKRLFFPRAKLAVIFHGYDVSSYVRAHGWQRYRAVAPLIDLPIAVNRTWANLLRTHAGMDKAVIHYLGAPVSRIKPWRGHTGPDFSALFVGRMTEKKGFDVLVEAVRLLRDADRKLTVHAVGGGPSLAAYRATIDRLGLSESILTYGARSHEFVLRLMAECDCFVAPSVTATDGDAEGIPVTLMEAMACGIPVISTRHSGIPELVRSGECGLLCPERDPYRLAEAIAALMDDPVWRRKLAEAARTRVLRDFDAARQNRVLFDTLKKLARRKSRRRAA